MGGIVSSIMGSDNEFTAKSREVNPNSYEYGGHANGARIESENMKRLANQAQDRQGVGINYRDANYDRTMGQWARNDQNSMAGLMAARARGQVPSIAGMQAGEDMRRLQAGAQQQMQTANAAQASAAASARGAAGMALAQQNAANNVANAQGQIGQSVSDAAMGISNQAQINAAQERMMAEQAAMGAYSNIRQGDAASQGMAAQQAQAQAQMSDAQRARNDQYDMQMRQNAMNVNLAQLQARQNREAQQSANDNAAQGINAGVSAQNAATNAGAGAAGAGAVGGALQAGSSMFGGGKAAGGPVLGSQAYLVGERGPELVIPARDATVIPADRTREILSRADGGAMAGMSPMQNAVQNRARGFLGNFAVTPPPNLDGLEANERADAIGAWQKQNISNNQILGGTGIGQILGRANGGYMAGAISREPGGNIKAPATAKPTEPAKPAEKTTAQQVGAVGKDVKDFGKSLEYKPGHYQVVNTYTAPQLLSVFPRAEGGPMQAPGSDAALRSEADNLYARMQADHDSYMARTPAVYAAPPSGLQSEADALRARMQADHDAAMSRGPAVRVSGAGLAGMSSRQPPPESSGASQLLVRAPVAPEKSAEEARKMPMKDLKSEADKLLAQMRSDHDAAMARGPSVAPKRDLKSEADDLYARMRAEQDAAMARGPAVRPYADREVTYVPAFARMRGY